MRIIYNFVFLSFSYIFLLYTSLVTIYLGHTFYLLLIYIYIYIWCMLFFTYLSMCYFFYIFIHMFLYVYNPLFLFQTKMPWFVLFKFFQKDKLSKSIMPWILCLQIFQEFVLVLYLTSDYEFSDLKLLSYFICLLWFCHGLPNGEIVRTYMDIVRDICYVNWLIFW